MTPENKQLLELIVENLATVINEQAQGSQVVLELCKSYLQQVIDEEALRLKS